ncbi:unnamed protein product [Allacma fusca]|uniref:C2H2-type domain-containing protein n=1 Tax=Allacma fusca TaxID=39272 RepID=A0A8J2KLU4_9HEXA|nr:unnamed protein product [Allacma fusca]
MAIALALSSSSLLGDRMEVGLIKRGRQGEGRSIVGRFRRGNRGSSSSFVPNNSSSSNNSSAHSGKKFFRCTTCSYVTNVKARFTKHVKYHSMPLIKCDFCDFKTPYKWNLDRHYKNHNGEGDLHCPLCNFTADIKQSLTVHVQNHHSSFPEQKLSIGVVVEMDEGRSDQDVFVNENTNKGLEQHVKKEQLSPRLLNKSTKQELNDDNDEMKPGIATKSTGGLQEVGAKLLQQTVVRRKSLCKEEPDENFEQKSVFLQSLALKPNVLYSVGNGEDGSSVQQLGLPSPPKLTTPKASPPGRRLSVTSSNELSSSNKKLHGSSAASNGTSGVKKNREKKLGLEELTQKLVASKSEENGASMLKNSVTITSNSTRCQYCRQRCKTSTDLAVHLTVCSEALRGSVSDESNNSNDKDCEDEVKLSTSELSVEAKDGSCSSENKIFVWNNNPYADEEEMGSGVMDYEFRSHFLEGNGSSDDLVGFETAPGVGAVHLGKLEEAEYEGYQGDLFDEQGCVTTTRKVFRCPQPNCGFWATTASRFHVHIVGHYNMKPFECSQCSYKSNWRWDITKHIKLKGMRDPSHSKAKVLLTHESGQRNYRKYDRYLIVMQLKHSADSKLPDCSTVASKRNDVELELSPSPTTVVASPKVSPQIKGVGSGSNMTMPKLTRAPITSRASSPSESVKSEESGSSRQRPPPALVPISGANPSGSNISGGRTFVEKKMLSGGRILSGDNVSPLIAGLGLPEISVEPCGPEGEIGPPTKKSRGGLGDSKKILWKCKKCPFKHASKEIVVFHIRQYHKPKRGESVSILSRNHLTSVPQDDDESQQSSEGSEQKSKFMATIKETHQYLFIEDEATFKCKFCPYTTTTLVAMESHAENHFSKPNCNFSCAHCSFSVPTKKELLQHAQLHGWDPGQPDDKGEGLTITAEETPPRPRSSSGNGGGTHKKYHCTECPYVTDSKGQFLYHKQFHRPRDCPFKCSQCSYTVSHKHLLHQHLRVHGLPPLSPPLGDVGSIPLLDDDEASNSTEDEPLNLHQSNNDTEKSTLESIHPTVLVWRNGRPFRMYRCRLCPQVYGKLGDLTEHEISHGNPVSSSSSSVQIPLQSQQNLTISPVNSGDSSSTTTILTGGKVLHCCEACPARFFYEKELEIHTSFHQSKSEFQCHLCSYSAKQQNPHLMSHMKVHGPEYQMKTQQLLLRYPKAPKRKKPQAPKNVSTLLNIPQVIPSMSISNGHRTQIKGRAAATILCQKCPAKFHTANSYQHHITFHGRETNFKCRHCDYGVDTMKNLTLHELLHAGSEISSDFEASGGNKNRGVSIISPAVHHHEDDTINDDAYVGNPDFIYPTYVKNGRVKSKRYKCSKCPSAFEKRDQYKVHMGLHGSDQRYRCTVCDYAVTYYANYIQHLKKHSTQPEVPPELLIAKPLSKMKGEGQSVNSKSSSPAKSATSPITSTNATISHEETRPKKKSPWKCNMCPFSTDDEKLYEEHKTRHIASSQNFKKSNAVHKCSFCDFAAASKSSLKDHVRLHFQVPAETLHSYMFSKEIDIYVNGNYDEKIYSEKENYDDDNGMDKEIGAPPNGNRHVAYIDLKRGLPVAMINDEDNDHENSLGEQPSPEPMDCTV